MQAAVGLAADVDAGKADEAVGMLGDEAGDVVVGDRAVRLGRLPPHDDAPADAGLIHFFEQ